jgi:hypothetical protein
MFLSSVHEIAGRIVKFPTTFDTNSAGSREVQPNLEASKADLI